MGFGIVEGPALRSAGNGISRAWLAQIIVYSGWYLADPEAASYG